MTRDEVRIQYKLAILAKMDLGACPYSELVAQAGALASQLIEEDEAYAFGKAGSSHEEQFREALRQCASGRLSAYSTMAIARDVLTQAGITDWPEPYDANPVGKDWRA